MPDPYMTQEKGPFACEMCEYFRPKQNNGCVSEGYIAWAEKHGLKRADGLGQAAPLSCSNWFERDYDIPVTQEFMDRYAKVYLKRSMGPNNASQLVEKYGQR